MARAMSIGLLLALIPAPAMAKVVSSSPQGFEVSSTVTVPVSPPIAYFALERIGQWWNKDHTYSGNAANLSLDLKAGGCLCELIPSDLGSVEHMRVVNVRPGSMLRLRGALGPLQGEGIDGALTWTFKPVPGGTEISQSYFVGGYAHGGIAALAAPVDQVLDEQLTRCRLSARPNCPAARQRRPISGGGCLDSAKT